LIVDIIQGGARGLLGGRCVPMSAAGLALYVHHVHNVHLWRSGMGLTS